MAVLLAAFCFALTAHATEYYVSKTGNDASNGTSWALARLTIQKGIDLATFDGDIVNVSNGVYTITASLAITNGIGITVRSLNGASNTTVTANNNAGVRGFKITGAGSTLDGLTITKGNINANPGGGGILFQDNGSVCTVKNCVILYNRTLNKPGAAVYVEATGKALLQNCVIAGNQNDGSDGTIALNNGGTLTIDNCTVTRNYSSGFSSGIYLIMNPTVIVRNTIVYDNRFFWGVVNSGDYGGGVFAFTNSCIFPKPVKGSGNVTNAPQFMYDGDGYGLSYSNNANLRLQPGSPCIDTALAAVAPLTDIEGNARNNDGNGDAVNGYDMGAYEAPAFGAGPLRFSLLQDRIGGITPFPVAFIATNVAGAQTGGLHYSWNFGDGQTTNGATLAVVTNNYATPGVYRASLILSNDQSEAATQYSLQILAPASKVYVAKGGSATSPYDTWAKAASNIQAAIDVSYADAGTNSVIWVSNGVYNLANQIRVDRRVAIQSVNGYSNTIIAGSDAERCLNVTPDGAGFVIDGFTVTNGYGANAGPGYKYGGGLYAAGSCLVRNCWFQKNRSVSDGGGGAVGADYSATLRLENCVLAGNWGKYAGAATAQNSSTIRFVNCTITGNQSDNVPAGIHVNPGATMTLTNSIVWNNYTTGGALSNYIPGTVTFAYSCSDPVPAGTGNTNANPLFVSAGAGYGLSHSNGNYRLADGSPCIDKGNNGGVSAATDLDGNPRIQGKQVDMGAYESPPPPPRGTVFTIR
ncbi:MAG: choice-of-anchor Q domain-containing protein [bacterium]